MSKIPETKEEWDSLPQEVRDRLSEFSLMDSIESIINSINDSVGPDEELAFRKILDVPKRSHRLFSWGWFLEKAEKRHYKAIRRNYE